MQVVPPIQAEFEAIDMRIAKRRRRKIGSFHPSFLLNVSVLAWCITLVSVRIQSVSALITRPLPTRPLHRLLSSRVAIASHTAGVAISEEKSLPTDINGSNCADGLTLVPVSRKPIILTSSRPLLTSDECDALRRYFAALENDGIDVSGGYYVEDLMDRGQRILNEVHDKIDYLTGFPRHDGESPLPRYLRYEPEPNTDLSRENLLPLGLHVDPNNGQYLRHISVLLYLTTNDAGATTFPLAYPLGMEVPSNSMEELEMAARELVGKDIHHTYKVDTEVSTKLEDAAVKLYENTALGSGGGMRIFPKAGHICVFYNYGCDGFADPNSFHGGEALIGETERSKDLLTFFKEIPLPLRDRDDFTEKIRGARRYLLERYFSS